MSGLAVYFLLVTGVLAFNLIVLVCSLVTAFSSVNRTMKVTRNIWSESEHLLSRLKNLVEELEDGKDRRNG